MDYGRKRTGLAVTDPLKIIATPLDTVPTHQLMDFLKRYAAAEQVECVVVGEPYQPSGLPSENLPRVRQFAARWRKEMPGIPIVFYDERFTSKIAQRAILDGGVRKEGRKDKALVDRVSATIILQDYMQSVNNR